MDELNKFKNNINWMAQCKKRINYPVDQADRAGLTAFEYGWKSFNRFYSEFEGGGERQRMMACVDKYLDFETFIQDVERILNGFSNAHKKLYVVDAQCNELNPRLEGEINSMLSSILELDFRGAVMHLLFALYLIRNARVHGAFCTNPRVYFSCLPRMIYEINAFVFCAKAELTRMEMDLLIDREVDFLRLS